MFLPQLISLLLADKPICMFILPRSLLEKYLAFTQEHRDRYPARKSLLVITNFCSCNRAAVKQDTGGCEAGRRQLSEHQKFAEIPHPRHSLKFRTLAPASAPAHRACPPAASHEASEASQRHVPEDG
jgi:hypothetical protein